MEKGWGEERNFESLKFINAELCLENSQGYFIGWIDVHLMHKINKHFIGIFMCIWRN